MTDRANKPVRFYLKAFAIGLCLFAYLLLGLYTEFRLIGIKPLPEKLIEDSNYYIRAFRDTEKGDDPYAVWDIGVGFLYPPPALLVVGALVRTTDLCQEYLGIDRVMLRAALLTITNVLFLALTIYGVARKYGYTLSDVWWWFPLGLGFAPFLEVLHVGQINVITQFGVFLMFALAESAPMVGGLGLALSIVTKVTPLAFVGYLLASRNLRGILGGLIGLVILSLLAGLAFGWQPFVAYVDIFRRLLDSFPLGANSQSLVAVLQSHGLLVDSRVPTAHRILTIYLLLVFAASAAIAYVSRQREPLFIVLSLGLALMPNVMWYHHYVFFLLPVFVWLAWSRQHPAVVVWCCLGLALIQIDRQYSILQVSHGALAHGFGHASILAILAWQVRLGCGILRGKPGLSELLGWRQV
jgi:hypothetical protein